MTLTTRETFEQVWQYVEFFEMMFKASNPPKNARQTIIQIRQDGQKVQAALAELNRTDEITLNPELIDSAVLIVGTVGHMLRGPVGPLLVGFGIDPMRAEQTAGVLRSMAAALSVPTSRTVLHA